MASKLVIVLIIADLFFLVAFVLAFTAERRRSTGHPEPDSEHNNNICVYGSHIATWLGICASIFLAIGQIIIMVASKCLCCGKPLTPGVSRTRAILLFITSWVAFFVTVVFLLAGSQRNAQTRYRTSALDRPLNCETARKGVFAAGAVFALVTSVLSELYYVYYSKARASPNSSGGENIVAMGEYK